jgi:hypothetical protein
MAFDVPVSNLSRSGMLLEWTNKKYTLPFIENTLVEIELTTELRGQRRKINILGKVTRKIGETSSSLYGIRLIHTAEQDHFEWLSIITTLEKALLQPATSKTL